MRRNKQLWRAAVVLATAAGWLFLGVESTSRVSAHGSLVLSGSGTATVDGVLGPGEWDNAAKFDFAVNRLASQGGGTTPATLFVMNDGTNVYFAVKVARNALDNGFSVGFEFDNDHDGVFFENGDDAIVLSAGPFLSDDVRTNQSPPCPPGSPPGFCGPGDFDVGGTNDGQGAATNNGTFSFYEISHPLNSGDIGHDLSLTSGNVVGFFMEFRFCDTGGCVDTFLSGDIVVSPATPVPYITTVAGNGTAGFSGDDVPCPFFSCFFGGPATRASLNIPVAVAVNGTGDLFIADANNFRIRRVAAASGIITTVAGNGVSGFSGDGGPATSASISNPSGVAVDKSGNLYIADRSNSRIRRVAAASGIITTVAGNGTRGFSGDGGPATSASLDIPDGVAVDTVGNIFIADDNNNRIRRVDAATGLITTVAGNGITGFSGDGGPATSASLTIPAGVAVDNSGNLFIADFANFRIRRVTAATGIITTVAGNGVSTFSGDGGPATSASFRGPVGVAVDAVGNIFIADQNDNRMRRVDAASGIITTLAGNGAFGFSGDGGPATSASFRAPTGVAIDPGGSLFIADSNNQRIRRLGLLNTPEGTSVFAQPRDATTGTAPVTVTFSTVTQAGSTTLGTSSTGAPAPSGFSLGSPPTYYDLTTGAVFSGSITVCINYGGITFADPSQLKLFHFEGGAWVGRTISLDTANKIICASVASLSPFAIFQSSTSSNRPPVANAGPDQTVECTSPAGASVTLNGSASSDPDGDPLSFEWRNAANALVGTTALVSLTLPLGTHTFTLTANDGHGGTASDSVVIVVRDTTPPLLTLSQSKITAVVPTATATGANVSLGGVASATDSCDPNPTITNNAPGVFPIGLTTVTFTATDHSGNSSQKQLTVQVVHNFIGFFNPIGRATFTSGGTIPVKFQLTAADGTVVTNATATLEVFLIGAGGSLQSVAVSSSGNSNVANLFRFDPIMNQYIYNLSTVGYGAGNYLLRARLNDQTSHDVQISIQQTGNC